MLRIMPAQGTQMSSLPAKSVMKAAKHFSRLSWLLTSTLRNVNMGNSTGKRGEGLVVFCLDAETRRDGEEGFRGFNYVEDGDVCSCFCETFCES